MAQIGSCLLEDATLCPEDAWSKQDERSTLKRKQHGTDGIAAHPFFFSTTPVCLGLKDKNVKGVGVLRFNGAAWETGWHFCPRDSLNVIINQPTSLFFEAFSSRAPSSHRRSVRRPTPEERRAVAIGRTPTRSPPSGDFH